MCKKTEQKNELREWYRSISINESVEKRTQLLKECRITTSVWCNWLSGRTEIPELAKPIINRISGKTIYD